MKLLPFHRFELISPLKPAAALTAMQAVTEPEKAFRFNWPSSGNDRRFEGAITGDNFRVRRIIGYRNSFLPVIDGTVHAQASGSRISITMRPFMFVYAFAAIWLFVSLTVLTTAPLPYGAIIGLLMAAFLYLMVMAGFWFEASKQEQTLRAIFNARIDTTTPLVS